MKIVYLNPSGKLGGAETSLRELLAGVRSAEPDWDLWLLLGEDGPLASIARDLGVNVAVKPYPPALARLGDAARRTSLLNLLGAAAATATYKRALARWLRGVDPDLIHTNGLKMHLLGAWARPRRSALIWHIHDYISRRPLMRLLLRPFRRRCATAIVNSRSVAADLEKTLVGLRIVPIYNAVDVQRFSPKGPRVDLDALAGLAPAPSGTVRIGLIATFARWKGHAVFLEALSRLPASLPLRGYIIGAPIYQTAGSQWSVSELQQQAKRLGLEDRVGFTGFIEDNAAAMRSLDIIVHASTQPEPFGMVIIEAMASGKAVIASQAGGAAEIFSEGENALAHAPGDVIALAHRMERLCRDAQLRDALGKSGRATAERFFHQRRLVDELLQIYHETPKHPPMQPHAAMSSIGAISK